jgi:hypothetical protein
MQEEAAFTPGEHDLAGPDVCERAARDLDHIARPKSGQHAFPVNLQTHALAQTIAATQNVCHQSRAFRVPTRSRRTHGVFQRQEVFRACWHWNVVEPSLPQDRASVSKTRS